ncbi:DUF2637 domain-containing protein [Streptomyces sp. NPDC050418]|uniref:DUF2637 domain-containing protein n=1 Tax=Streptomyces sp. NPDC050418 TaxID=3365612 RepID=UPI00378F83DB
MPTPAPTPFAEIPGNRSLRRAIILLGAVGFALSYDALRQMAVAVHIRWLLTYLFPLVIDGFIAIGVVALLLLRTAPWRSRLYVWTLVGGATITSVWANALHAIRLNERTRLVLDNATVGALSAIAPLALAGAVHLYLVINRHLTATRTAAEPPSARSSAKPLPPDAMRPPRQEKRQNDDAGAPSAKALTATATPPRSVKASPKKGGNRQTVPDDVLHATAHRIGAESGVVPRTTLEDTVRAQGYTIQKDRAKEVAKSVTAELAAARANSNAA